MVSKLQRFKSSRSTSVSCATPNSEPCIENTTTGQKGYDKLSRTDIRFRLNLDSPEVFVTEQNWPEIVQALAVFLDPFPDALWIGWVLDGDFCDRHNVSEYAMIRLTFVLLQEWLRLKLDRRPG